MKIFLSAVSGQFKACRDALRSDLSAVGAEVVVQEDFQQHGASLLEKLERYIASCDRIIALVGDAYGFESEETARPAGQPGSGKSTLALKFAWQTQGAFVAVVFQVCGQRSVAEIVAELAAKLKLEGETRSPEERLAAVQGWFSQRRTLLVLDDVWENEVISQLAASPFVWLLCTSMQRSFPGVSVTHSLEVTSFSRAEAESVFRIYLKDQTVERHRDALLEFAERMERLPIAIVVGADLLRHELDPIPEASRGLRLEKLRNEVHDVPELLRRAIAARPEAQRRLLNAMAVCALLNAKSREINSFLSGKTCSRPNGRTEE
jgi:NB-ARC domain/Domain of unknown function (DUF4062)